MARGGNYLVGVLMVLPLFIWSCSRTEQLKPIVLPPTPAISVRAHWGVVQSGYLRAFADPTGTAPIRFILRSGDIVEITAKSSYTNVNRGQRDYWYHVVFDKQNGWVFGNGLDLYESRERAENASRLLQND